MNRSISAQVGHGFAGKGRISQTKIHVLQRRDRQCRGRASPRSILAMVEADASFERIGRRHHATQRAAFHSGLGAAGGEDARIVDAPNLFVATVMFEEGGELCVDPRLAGAVRRRTRRRRASANLLRPVREDVCFVLIVRSLFMDAPPGIVLRATPRRHLSGGRYENQGRRCEYYCEGETRGLRTGELQIGDCKLQIEASADCGPRRRAFNLSFAIFDSQLSPLINSVNTKCHSRMHHGLHG